MSCFDALRSAVGAPCGFSGRCATSDLCCAAAVTCEGGVVVELNHPPECDGGVRPTLCVRGRSSVSGNTPLGPVDFDSSYASFSSAQDVVLIMTTSSIRNSFAVCGGDRLSFWLFPTEGATGVPAGIDRAGEALAQLVVGDVIVHTRAVFESVDEAAVSAFGPLAKPSLSGSFRLDEPGWDVSGAFTVYGC